MPYCWACATSQAATVQAPSRCTCTTAVVLFFFFFPERSVVILDQHCVLALRAERLGQLLQRPGQVGLDPWPAGVYQQDTSAGEVPVKYPVSWVAIPTHCS